MPDPLTEIEAERQRCYRRKTVPASRLVRWLDVAEGLYLLINDLDKEAPGFVREIIARRMKEMEL